LEKLDKEIMVLLDEAFQSFKTASERLVDYKGEVKAELFEFYRSIPTGT
jgi:hypothetical protein